MSLVEMLLDEEKVKLIVNSNYEKGNAAVEKFSGLVTIIGNNYPEHLHFINKFIMPNIEKWRKTAEEN